MSIFRFGWSNLSDGYSFVVSSQGNLQKEISLQSLHSFDLDNLLEVRYYFGYSKFLA